MYKVIKEIEGFDLKVGDILHMCGMYTNIESNQITDVKFIREKDDRIYSLKFNNNNFNECFQNIGQYYIISNKLTKGLTRTFWKANSDGYTIDLGEAGIYTEDDIEFKRYPLITKENLSNWGSYDNFFIAVEDVQLLGKKMICIMN
jgi:hypothetical protein